jgi:CheY-like chemotaxis protein
MQGKRVLVVEDESLVAMLVEDLLAELGCTVSGSPATVADALAAVAGGGFDVALLDVNLAGERVDPVADALVACQVPFAFASGYGAAGVPAAHADAPIIAKPFRLQDLAQALASALSR